MKKYYKIAAVAAAVIMAATGVTAYAAGENSAAIRETDIAENSEKTKADEITASKDETVYVLANADGSTQKIIVSDWLKNTSESAKLNDISCLSDIENVKGSENFSGSGGSMTWSADGNDIYYQGNSSKALPIDMKVTYTLNGNEIAPADLAGKSGKLVIRYEFKNNQYENIEVGGKTEKICVPFAVLTGIMLDSDTCRNIEVTNGKLLNDGDKTFIAGIAFPGLRENLGIDSEKLDIPDSFEVSADVTDFEMTNTLTIVTNELFNGIDIGETDSLDDLDASVSKLSDGMDSLMDGSSKLYDGLCELLDKSGELVSGIDALYDGAEKLNAGAGQLDGGAAELSTGAQQLSAGLEQLSANSAALGNGAEQVFVTLLSTADSRLTEAGLELPELTVQNYAQVLENAAAGFDKNAVYDMALKKVTDAVEQQRDTVKQAVTAAVKEEVTARVLAAMELTPEEYKAGIAAGVITSEQQAQVNAAVDAQMNSNEISELIETKTDEQVTLLIEEKMSSTEIKKQIADGEKQAADGAKQLMELKAQLDSYNEFYTGLLTYTDGVDTASAGAKQLSAGASELKSGTSQLSGGAEELLAGIGKLKEAAPALIDGITQLRDGSGKLSDGLTEFNEKGIQKLIDAVDGDIAGLVDRFNATVRASDNYRTYSGISDGMNGSVKFIFRTDEIAAE